MSVLCSVRVVASALLCAMGLCLVTPNTTQAQPANCDTAPPSGFDLREDPFNLSASERDAILDVIHAFALTWDLRDETNLPLLFIDGDAGDGFLFKVCTSAAGTANTGAQIIAAVTRTELSEYFEEGPFTYVQDPNNPLQARHFTSNVVVKSHELNDVKVVASLLVTLQGAADAQGVAPLPVVDYTGTIEAVLTKEWGGVWKFRKLLIYMDVPYSSADGIFRGR